MNNPFATVPTPAAQQPTMQANPFAPQAPVQQHQPSFPTSAPTANPFAAVVPAASAAPAPPVQVHTQGVAAIQTAFAFPPLNPPGEVGLGLQPVVTAPAVVFEAPAAPVPPEPASKARRSRKPKAVDGPPAGFTDHVNANGDTVRYADPSPQDELGFDEGHPGGDVPCTTIESATTEELRDALNARGWNVTLVAS